MKITGLRKPYVKIDPLHQGFRRAVTTSDHRFAFMKPAIMAVIVANGTFRAREAIEIMTRKTKNGIQLISLHFPVCNVLRFFRGGRRTQYLDIPGMLGMYDAFPPPRSMSFT